MPQAAIRSTRACMEEAMIRDITLGQYYPIESPIHRLDPRTKLAGTLIFIVALFVAQGLVAYLIATAFLASVIRVSKDRDIWIF